MFHPLKLLLILKIIYAVHLAAMDPADNCLFICFAGQKCGPDKCIDCEKGTFQPTAEHMEKICKHHTERPPGNHWVLKQAGTTISDNVWDCEEGFQKYQYSPHKNYLECRPVSASTHKTSIAPNISLSFTTDGNESISGVNTTLSIDSPDSENSNGTLQWIIPVSILSGLIVLFVLLVLVVVKKRRSRIRDRRRSRDEMNVHQNFPRLLSPSDSHDDGHQETIISMQSDSNAIAHEGDAASDGQLCGNELGNSNGHVDTSVDKGNSNGHVDTYVDEGNSNGHVDTSVDKGNSNGHVDTSVDKGNSNGHVDTYVDEGNSNGHAGMLIDEVSPGKHSSSSEDDATQAKQPCNKNNESDKVVTGKKDLDSSRGHERKNKQEDGIQSRERRKSLKEKEASLATKIFLELRGDEATIFLHQLPDVGKFKPEIYRSYLKHHVKSFEETFIKYLKKCFLSNQAFVTELKTTFHFLKRSDILKNKDLNSLWSDIQDDYDKRNEVAIELLNILGRDSLKDLLVCFDPKEYIKKETLTKLEDEGNCIRFFLKFTYERDSHSRFEHLIRTEEKYLKCRTLLKNYDW